MKKQGEGQQGKGIRLIGNGEEGGGSLGRPLAKSASYHCIQVAGGWTTPRHYHRSLCLLQLLVNFIVFNFQSWKWREVGGTVQGELAQLLLEEQNGSIPIVPSIYKPGFVLSAKPKYVFQSVMAGGRGQGGDGQGGLLSILGHSVGLLTRKSKRQISISIFER